ncbi:MAG TPA: TlpA family protein disulfide reductase [Lachnospiraceae bacterium]|nr:TlpA family protein disulfide reductase [Lachnospiraceae bacterium]
MVSSARHKRRKENMAMKNKKMIARICSAVLALSMLMSGCSTGGSDTGTNTKPSGSQGGQAPQGTAAELGSLKSFTAKTLDGGTFTQKDFADKDITVLNFWSTMCGPCIDEMPELAKFARALPDNVQVVTVCLDGTGMEDYARSLLGDFDGVTILSGDGDYSDVDGNIQYTPTTVLVDNGGNFVGDAMIDGQEDLSKSFLDAVNGALASMGKEEISLVE